MLIQKQNLSQLIRKWTPGNFHLFLMPTCILWKAAMLTTIPQHLGLPVSFELLVELVLGKIYYLCEPDLIIKLLAVIHIVHLRRETANGRITVSY